MLHDVDFKVDLRVTNAKDVAVHYFKRMHETHHMIFPQYVRFSNRCLNQGLPKYEAIIKYLGSCVCVCVDFTVSARFDYDLEGNRC